MKKSLKSLMAMFIMVMAFAVTGIVSNAMEATYTPTTVTDLSKISSVNVSKRTVTVPAKSSVVIPIKVPAKGGLWLVYAGGDNLYGTVYKDSSCTTYQCYVGYFSSTKSNLKEASFSQAGTYYLKIENNSSISAQQAVIAGYFFSGADKTLTSGKVNVTYQNDYNTWVYHKFKATKTGYINVTTAEADDYTVYVKLLSSSKKALSNEIVTYSSNNVASFGVQKGKTYYIATRSYANTVYNIKYTNTKVSEKSGAKKSKAVTIKKNKTIKGTMIANGKKSGYDYYKIKLTSSKKVTFTINGRASGIGDIKIQVIPASSRVKLYGNTMNVPEYGSAKYTTTMKLPKGTYYLKVYKYDKNSSGYYSIK